MNYVIYIVWLQYESTKQIGNPFLRPKNSIINIQYLKLQLIDRIILAYNNTKPKCFLFQYKLQIYQLIQCLPTCMSSTSLTSSNKQKLQPKKLHNRFDEWEVLSIFVQSTSTYLNELYTTANYKFYIRCILGITMAINAYLSHFGPWTWPSNFYFLIFSVLFFFSASSFYNRLGDINPDEGSKVGEYIVGGIKYIYAFKLTPERIEYIMEEIETQTKEVKRKKSFNYLEYFTQQGDFLQQKYLKHLQGFMCGSKK